MEIVCNVAHCPARCPFNADPAASADVACLIHGDLADAILSATSALSARPSARGA